jgi:hypothetical protein
MTDAPRISTDKARDMLRKKHALLVCAYKGEKCERNRLPGALCYEEFKQRLADLDKSTRIIFY